MSKRNNTRSIYIIYIMDESYDVRNITCEKI